MGNLYTTGYNWIIGLKDGIIAAFSSVATTVTGWVSKIKSLATGASKAAATTSSHVNRLEVQSTGKTKYGDNTFLASGGIVSRATRAIVGESGPEAIIPLDKFPAIFGEIALNMLSGIKSPIPSGISSDLRSGISNVINDSSTQSNVNNYTTTIGPNSLSNDMDLQTLVSAVKSSIANDRRKAGIL